MRRFFAFSMGLFSLFLGSCATAPAAKTFDFIDKITLELPLVRRKNALELTGKAAMVFAKAMPAVENASMQWSCKLSLDAKLTGSSQAFHKRLNESLLKQGLLTQIPAQGELVIRSSVEKTNSGGKQFNLRLAEVLGSYRLSEEPAGTVFFRNPSGYAFSGFVASARGFEALELMLASDLAKANEERKNLLCAEIQEGVQFKPKTE